MDDLVSNQPLYIVIVENDANNITQKTSKQYFDEFDTFSSFVQQNYFIETAIEDFNIWRLKENRTGDQ